MFFNKSELKEFIDSGVKILKNVEVKENPVLKWSKWRNPLRQAFNWGLVILMKPLPPCTFKNSVYRLMGVKIGRNVAIGNECLLDPIFPELIRLDDNVILGWGSKIYTHEYTQNNIRIGSVHVGEGSLIGEWSLIRPGVHVGKNSVTGAMSFVNKDVDDDAVVGGVPAKKIKK